MSNEKLKKLLEKAVVQFLSPDKVLLDKNGYHQALAELSKPDCQQPEKKRGGCPVEYEEEKPEPSELAVLREMIEVFEYSEPHEKLWYETAKILLSHIAHQAKEQAKWINELLIENRKLRKANLSFAPTLIKQQNKIKELTAENKRLKIFLQEKVAIAKVSADNKDYCLNITIAEIEQVLEGE
jgi:hypothetical protein